MCPPGSSTYDVVFIHYINILSPGTSTVEPLLWYSFMTVGIQMLLSFVYFASILSMAILPRKSSKVGPVPVVKERCKQLVFKVCCTYMYSLQEVVFPPG